MLNQKVEIFKNELMLIEDDNLRKFISIYLENCPDYFFTMPASSTGKYHPAYTLGTGGLIRHTKAAVKVAYDMLSLEQNHSLRLFKDEIIASLIVHDSLKKGLNEHNMYSLAEHPVLASRYIKEIWSKYFETNKNSFPDKDQIEFISNLVLCHMGQWNTDWKSNAEIMPKPRTDCEKFVHLCDYLASRKFLTIEL